MSKYTPFEVVITAIIIKDGKYLITRRSPEKKRFPGMWVVPGGHLDPEDFMGYPKETEEVGLEINNVRYVTSLATEHKDGAASIVISCLADYKAGEVILEKGETDKAEWVSLKEAKDYDLVDGIYDELVMSENLLKTGKIGDWKRH